MTEDPLANLRRIMTRRRRTVATLADIDLERDAEITSLLRAKAAPVANIEAEADLKKARLYQIRDGNRGHAVERSHD